MLCPLSIVATDTRPSYPASSQPVVLHCLLLHPPDDRSTLQTVEGQSSKAYPIMQQSQKQL